MRFDPGKRHVKRRKPLILHAEKSALKSACKRARSVGVMLLVAGGSQWEKAQLFKVGVSSNARVRIIDQATRIASSWKENLIVQDGFAVSSVKITALTVCVFDRWGELYKCSSKRQRCELKKGSGQLIQLNIDLKICKGESNQQITKKT